METTADLSSDFKVAMRRLAATVTIVTTWNPSTGLRYGMTATAVTSLTTDPPALLVCVNRSASMHPTLTVGSKFCVNILGEPHTELAVAFGGQAKPEIRFEAGEWDANAGAAPLLTDAVAAVLCQVDQLVEYGTHSIVIGRVDAVCVNPSQRSLIWADGQFAQLA